MIDTIVAAAKQALREKSDVPQEDRNYVDSVEEVPEGYEPHRGDLDGIFWVDDSASGGGSDESSGGGSESSDGIEAPEDKPSDSPEDDEDEADGNSHDPNPEVDVPEFKENDDVDDLIESTNDEPMMGFTLHRDLEPQPLGEDDVWAVGAASINHDDGLSKEKVLETYREYQEVLDEYTGVRLGGYHFKGGGQWSVDVSLALTDKEEAMEFGEELNQESIFNLGTTENEDTGGDGESPVDGPDDLREYIERADSRSEKILKMDDWDAHLAVFENDDGDQLNFYQMAKTASKGLWELEEVEEGFEVDGELYRRVDDNDAEKVADAAIERLEEKVGGNDEGN